MAGSGLPCSSHASCRHNGRRHGEKQAQDRRDGQKSPHVTNKTISLFSPPTQSETKYLDIKLANVAITKGQRTSGGGLSIHSRVLNQQQVTAERKPCKHCAAGTPVIQMDGVARPADANSYGPPVQAEGAVKIGSANAMLPQIKIHGWRND